MPVPPKSGSAVMPSTPSAPSSAHRCAGKTLLRSSSAAIGAILSWAKRRTRSRRLSMSSPSPKFSVRSYISLLPGSVCAHKAPCHGKVGFCDLFDSEPLVRSEPDDHAGDHLDDGHGGHADIVDGERPGIGAVAQNLAQFLLVCRAQAQDAGEVVFGKAAQ